jgi:hypothetical protein
LAGTIFELEKEMSLDFFRVEKGMAMSSDRSLTRMIFSFGYSIDSIPSRVMP